MRKPADPLTLETRTEFAMRLYDTATPPVSANRAAGMAGIHRNTLYAALQRRQDQVEGRCPHCHRHPRERSPTGVRRRERSTIPVEDHGLQGSVRRVLGIPELGTVRTTQHRLRQPTGVIA